MKTLTIIAVDIPYCALTYAVAPCTAGLAVLAVATLGENIGDLIGGGGLEAMFDGTEVKPLADSATRSNVSTARYGGKYWGVPRVIRTVVITAPSNAAFVRNSSNVGTASIARLKGSDDGVNWTQLDTVPTTTTVGQARTLSSLSTTPYLYHAVFIDPVDASSDIGIASSVWTETVTGEKCFNTDRTCQDPDNYSETTVTIYFSNQAAYVPGARVTIPLPLIPCIKGEPEFTPGTLLLGDGLGDRSILTVSLEDRPDADTRPGFDKYYAERYYDPMEQGSLFAKLRARQPYLQGAAMRWYQGQVGDILDGMEVRSFFVDSFTGPDQDGVFQIVARDPLKALDSDRAVAPRLSEGVLAGDIDEDDTSLTLLPLGIGSTYAASGFVCIGGSEICSFTRTGDTMTIVRARVGTKASTHEAQDRVQIVLRYLVESPATIIRSLEVTYGNIPIGLTNLAEWQAEIDAFLDQVYTIYIPEPRPVRELVSLMCQTAGLAHWWNDRDGKLEVRVIREVGSDAYLFTEANTDKDYFDIKDQPEKRISRVQTYLAVADPTQGWDDANNYKSSQENANELIEEKLPSMIRVVKTPFIPAGGKTVAEKLNLILLSRYSQGPRLITMAVPRGKGIVPTVGTGYRVSHPMIQDAYGAREIVPAQVTRVTPGRGMIVFEMEEMRFDSSIVADVNDHTVIVDTDTPNFVLRAAHDAIYGPPEVGITITCIILAGVKVYATSTATPAFQVGSITGSIPVNVIVDGRIQGKGGVGGRGGRYYDGPSIGDTESTDATPGSAGGPAFKTTRAVNLSGAGEIWSGGGGGGGGGAYISSSPTDASCGGGGGGGQGKNVGNGGSSMGTGHAGSASTSEAPGARGTGSHNGKGGGDGGTEGAAGNAGNDADFPSVAHSWRYGGAGGAPGIAIDGDSFVTETGTLDVKGTRV